MAKDKKWLIENIKHYLDNDVSNYEGCYLNREVLELIIKILEQKPCSDYINRQSVKQMLYDEFEGWPTDEEVILLKRLTKQIDDLPAVAPNEQRTGHWINAYDGNAICGCCNRLNRLYGKYCKHCGAKMK